MIFLPSSWGEIARSLDKPLAVDSLSLSREEVVHTRFSAFIQFTLHHFHAAFIISPKLGDQAVFQAHECRRTNVARSASLQLIR